MDGSVIELFPEAQRSVWVEQMNILRQSQNMDENARHAFFQAAGMVISGMYARENGSNVVALGSGFSDGHRLTQIGGVIAGGFGLNDNKVSISIVVPEYSKESEFRIVRRGGGSEVVLSVFIDKEGQCLRSEFKQGVGYEHDIVATVESDGSVKSASASESLPERIRNFGAIVQYMLNEDTLSTPADIGDAISWGTMNI